MKVHITLTERARSNSAEKARALRVLETTAGLSGVNVKRFERYGIATGDLPEAQLEFVRRLECVATVEKDSAQRALDGETADRVS
jgi:hypothetical protein